MDGVKKKKVQVGKYIQSVTNSTYLATGMGIISVSMSIPA